MKQHHETVTEQFNHLHLPLICDSQHQLQMEKLISTYTNHNHLNDGSIPEADFSPRCIQSKSQPLDYLNRSESWDTNVDCFTNCKHVFPALTKRDH